jgi:hypothetical protein
MPLLFPGVDWRRQWLSWSKQREQLGGKICTVMYPPRKERETIRIEKYWQDEKEVGKAGGKRVCVLCVYVRERRRRRAQRRG